MKDIVFLTNNYNDFRFTFLHECFAEEFKKLGVRMDVVDIKTGLNTLGSVYSRNTPFFLSFNADGINLGYNNKSLFTATGCPLITVCEDIAANYSNKVSNADNENVVFLIYDRSDDYYINRYIPSIRHFYFLGWWGICLKEKFPDISERPLDITFCGSVVPESEIRSCFVDKKWNEISLQKFFDNVIDILLYQDSMTAVEAVEQVAGYHNIQILGSDPTFHDIVFTAMVFVRDKRRRIILRDLVQHGLKVDFFGYKRQYDAIGEDKLRYNKPIDMKTNLDLMRFSKIVLNTNSLTRAAVNTRQLSAMMAKAVVLTDSNELNDEHFRANIDYALFKNSEPELLTDIAYDLLQNHNRMQDIANVASKRAIDGFSLTKFVGSIMTAYNELKGT